MPYNYVVDRKLRKNIQGLIENSIIIFDEAHNIEEYCENVESFTFSLENLIELEKEIMILYMRYNKNLTKIVRKDEIYFI